MIQQQIYNALKPLVSGRCFYGVIPDTNKDYPVIVYQFPNISPNSGDMQDILGAVLADAGFDSFVKDEEGQK